MNNVTSSDGTIVDLDWSGTDCHPGGGGSTDRSANALLATLLAKHFTLSNRDRRGVETIRTGCAPFGSRRTPASRTLGAPQGQRTSIRRGEA